MILRMAGAHARRRARDLVVVGLAVTAAAAGVAATTGLGSRLDAALRSRLHAFGPNLVLRPQPGVSTLPQTALTQILGLEAVELAVPFAPLADGTSPATLATGRELLELYPGAELEGRWPDAGEVLLGARATLDARSAPSSGTLRTGDELDDEILVDLATLPTARLARIEIRSAPESLESAVAAIAAAVPGAEVVPLARVTRAEERLTRQLDAVLGGVAVATLLLALATVASTTAAQVHTRRREIALLVSLGLRRGQVLLLLLSETLALGLGAALLGAALGDWAAHRLARRAFDAAGEAWLRHGLTSAAAALVTVLLVVATAALLTQRRLQKLPVAGILHGR